MPETINNVNNISNSSPAIKLGVLAVPDKLPKPIIYSEAEARKSFKVLTSDIFEAKEDITYESTTKTPKGLLTLGAVLIATAIAAKMGAFSKVKNLFMKRTNS